MAFTEVRCSRCYHIGFACAGALPKMLRCCGCGFVEFFRCGKQTIRAVYIEDDLEADGWRRYDAAPRQQQVSAPPQPQQRKPRSRWRKKVRLTPRVAETV